MKYYKVSQKERDIFHAFYKQVTQVGFEEPLYQYTLVSPAFTYLTTNKIPFHKVEVACECSMTIQLLVPKSKLAKEMENINVD